jgi:hypothetical protein
MLEAELQTALNFFEDFLEITFARAASANTLRRRSALESCGLVPAPYPLGLVQLIVLGLLRGQEK